MKLQERSGRWGELIFELKDADTGELIRRWRQKNLLTNANGTQFQRMLRGQSHDMTIAYFAVGTGTTAPARTDTTLANEAFRKQVTQLSSSRSGTDFRVTSVCSLSSGEANFRIREVGVFCGATATATANTGTMISRVLVDFTKNSNQVLNIYRVDHLILG